MILNKNETIRVALQENGAWGKYMRILDSGFVWFANTL